MNQAKSRPARPVLERIRTALRQARISATPQRLEIFRVIADSTDHPDVETVYRRVRDTLPTVSLDTVYRTLGLFQELGLVDTLGPPRGPQRYDARQDAHHHFVCVRCGRTRDFLSPDLDRLRMPDVVRSWGSAVKIRVEVRGVCADCSKKGKTKTARS